MWGLEYIGEQADPQPVGDVNISGDYEVAKKPVWLVLLKLVGVLAVAAIGVALVVPWVPLPWWQSLTIALGVLLIYVGVAFFVRPEANMENMGWLGGAIDDPMHYSDDMNRALWSLHCCLGPGRFVAGAVIDACALVGLAGDGSAGAAQPAPAEEPASAARTSAAQPAPLQADRFEDDDDFSFGGAVELSSARFLNRPE